MTETAHIVRAYDHEIGLLTRKTIEMGGLVESQLSNAILALERRNEELARNVISRDKRVDALEEEIDQFAIKTLATRQPMAVDLRTVAMALKISNDLERISDYAVNIARRYLNLQDDPPTHSVGQIKTMGELCQRMIKDVLDAYIERDDVQARAVWHADDQVDALYDSIFRGLLTHMLGDTRTITPCTQMLFIAKNLERIGDHCTNIAEKVVYMVSGEAINQLEDGDTGDQ